MPSIVIPTPPATGVARLTAPDGTGLEFRSRQEASDWARDQLADTNFLFVLAIWLAANRPTMRGKTLTVDLTQTANLVTVA